MRKKKLNPVLFASITTSDIDMVTVKTLKAIQTADIVIIDCLLKSKIQKITKKNAEIIHILKKKMSDEEEHRSHVIRIIDSIEANYNAGKKVIRLVDAQTFLSKHIHTEFRLLKSRKIKTRILPEPGIDYHSPNQTKNLSFFSIHCDMRNVESLWHKLTDCYNSGQSVLLYSSINIHDQFSYYMSNNEQFKNAQIDVFNISNKNNSCISAENYRGNNASIYFIGH